jgi:antitoxin Phd
VQDAKARFGEWLETCLEQGPQVVTKRGVETAVLVPIDQWRRVKAARPTLKQLLLAPEPRFELPIPPRGQLRRRPPTELV